MDQEVVDELEIPEPAPPPAPQVPRPAKPVVLEIGTVYRRGTKRWLAVGERLLGTMRSGSWVEQAVTAKGIKGLAKLRHVAVEELCKPWKITVEELDRILSERYPHPTPGQRTRPGKGAKTGLIGSSTKPRLEKDHEAIGLALRQVRLRMS